MSTLSAYFHVLPVGTELDDETMQFVQNWHYSKSCRSMKQKFVFKLYESRTNILVGVAIYGQPMAMREQDKTLELRRFCLSDRAPRNSESFFLSWTLRWLSGKQVEYNRVVTFADPNQGHQGIIYKATNFTFDGLEKNGNPRIVKVGNKVHHIRQYYDKKDGEYSKQALKLQALVAQGKAQIIAQERKLRYVYNLQH